MVAGIPGGNSQLFFLNFFEKLTQYVSPLAPREKAQESLVSHPADYGEVAGQRVNEG